MTQRLKVIFAPDWRAGVPYQQLLATALPRHGVDVAFLQGYRRGLPLSRLLEGQQFDFLHLHWPEAYFPKLGDGLDWFRVVRFPLDLNLGGQASKLGHHGSQFRCPQSLR